jgi:hypothetical protein
MQPSPTNVIGERGVTPVALVEHHGDTIQPDVTTGRIDRRMLDNDRRSARAVEDDLVQLGLPNIGVGSTDFESRSSTIGPSVLGSRKSSFGFT